MATAPSPHLPFPTCADCARIGLYVPPVLFDMERALGPDTLKAFLLAHGGRQISLSQAMPEVATADPVSQAEGWLRRTVGFGKIMVPKGPASRTARITWATYRMLTDGHSVSEIARATDCHMRSVSMRKKKFADLGLLPSPPSTPRQSQETPQC